MALDAELPDSVAPRATASRRHIAGAALLLAAVLLAAWWLRR